MTIGVKIVDTGLHDYCPMSGQNQLFSIFNGDEYIKSFVVNHNDHYTATQYIHANGPEFDFDWTHVRSATVQEARDWSSS